MIIGSRIPGIMDSVLSLIMMTKKKVNGRQWGCLPDIFSEGTGYIYRRGFGIGGDRTAYTVDLG